MKKEDFIALGISAELAEKAAEASKTELSGFVPKSRFDEVNEAKKGLEKTNSEYKTQLEDLKKSAGDNEELKKQIETLQEKNKQAEEAHAKEIADMKLTNALKANITNAHDADMIIGLLDKEKITLDDKGVLTGLKEQVETIQKDKPFLFKDSKQENNGKGGAGFNIGAQKQNNGDDGNGSISLSDAVGAFLRN